MRCEEVGDAGEVGQHVVAVEPDERQQLAQHLEDLRRHQQEDRVVARHPPGADGHHGDDRVEVQPTEVGAQASDPSESVGVGDVGVERRPHEVEPGPHDARSSATPPRRGRMAELVEARGEDGDGEDREQQSGARERLVGGRGEALVEEHPPRDPRKARQQRQCDDRVEQGGERCGEPTGLLLVGDRDLEPEAEQRVAPRQLGRRTVLRWPPDPWAAASPPAHARCPPRPACPSPAPPRRRSGRTCAHRRARTAWRRGGASAGRSARRSGGRVQGACDSPTPASRRSAPPRRRVRGRRRPRRRLCGDRGRSRVGHGWGWSGCEMSARTGRRSPRRHP